MSERSSGSNSNNNVDTAASSAESPRLKKVTILTTGTRGDIQPFVAIGIALKRKGYRVRILTHPSPTHTKLCEDFGLEHVPFGNDAEAYMKTDKEARLAMETGNTIKFFGCLAKIIQDSTLTTCQPFCEEIIRGKQQRPDLLIVSFLNRFFGFYAKHVLHIPTIEIKLQHWVFDDPSRAPMGMPTLPFGGHRLIHTHLMIPQDYRGFQTFDNCIATILASSSDGTPKSTAQLPTMDDFLLYDQWHDSEVNHSPLLPMLIAQPPMFQNVLCPTLPAPAPSSLSKKNTSLRCKYVGPAIIESNDQIDGENMLPNSSSFGGEISKRKLEDFLAASEQKPIYMGWGSMIRKSPQEMSLFAIRVLQQTRQRGIVLGGLAGLGTEVLEEAVQESSATPEEKDSILKYAKENVIFVDRAPHEWLFPQVALTVHHGGAGTLNASLRAGVPTIVTPVFGDQYDNAFVVQKLGVGFGFGDKLQNITAHTLAKTIDSVRKDPDIARKAQGVASQLRSSSESGSCEAIVKELESYWNDTVVSGDFLEDVHEWKVATQEKKARSKETKLRNRIVLASTIGVGMLAYVLAN